MAAILAVFGSALSRPQCYCDFLQILERENITALGVSFLKSAKSADIFLKLWLTVFSKERQNGR